MSNDWTPCGVREVLVVYRYEIEPRPAAPGGGVRLYLYGPDQETGQEIELGGGVFPSGLEEAEIKEAYAEGQWEGDSGLDSRPCS